MCEAKKEEIKQSFEPIAQAMLKLDMSMYILAKKADVNSATLYSWANGDYKPKADKVIKICNALGLDFRNFL